MKRKTRNASKNGLAVRILTTYPIRDASRRLRIQPIAGIFASNGYKVSIDEIFTDRAYAWKNAWGWRRALAAIIVALRLCRRAVSLVIRSQTDVVIVHREAFPFFTPTFEKLAIRNAKVAVLDIDDATYHEVTHGKDWRRYLRSAKGALRFSELFDLILCGNYELMEVFGSSSASAVYAPTCPDINVHAISPNTANEKFDAVWIGSQSTLSSLCKYLPDIRLALERTGSTLLVLGGPNVNSLDGDDRIRARVWSQELELEALSNCRVGIMPLPDTEWERGKSGYKAIMYLCSGLNAVISPVGFNRVLCEEFGAVPCRDDEWNSVLAAALSDPREVGSDQLKLIRSTFDPQAVAARSYREISDTLSRKGQVEANDFR